MPKIIVDVVALGSFEIERDTMEECLEHLDSYSHGELIMEAENATGFEVIRTEVNEAAESYKRSNSR